MGDFYTDVIQRDARFESTGRISDRELLERARARAEVIDDEDPSLEMPEHALLGEALLTASLPLLGLFSLGVIINVIYIPLSEEPGLVRRFGDDYLTYKRNVPRWIPRLKPWQPEDFKGEVGRHEKGAGGRCDGRSR